MLSVDFCQQRGRDERRRTDSAAGAQGAPRSLGAQSAAQRAAPPPARRARSRSGRAQRGVLRLLVEDGKGMGFRAASGARRAGDVDPPATSCSRVWRRRLRPSRRLLPHAPGPLAADRARRRAPAGPPAAALLRRPHATTRSAASASSTWRSASSNGTRRRRREQPRYAPLILVPVRLERGERRRALPPLVRRGGDRDQPVARREAAPGLRPDACRRSTPPSGSMPTVYCRAVAEAVSARAALSGARRRHRARACSRSPSC